MSTMKRWDGTEKSNPVIPRDGLEADGVELARKIVALDNRIGFEMRVTTSAWEAITDEARAILERVGE